MAEVQIRNRSDEACTDPVVALADLIAGSNASAVRLEPGDDAYALLPHLDQIKLIEITFPIFGDGRGYSSARILRERGFTGELRASGDVLVDQIAFLTRCGFDSFAPEKPLDEKVVAAGLTRFPEVYQKTTDGQNPIWALRHGLTA